MKLAFMASLGYAQMKPEQVCQSLSKLGYNGVEWTLNHFNPRAKSEKELKDIVRITKGNGLEVSEVVVQQDYVSLDENIRKDRIALTKECINVFSDLGINTINLFTGPAFWESDSPKIGKDITQGEAWDMVLSAYDEILPLAEEKKMNLAVEGVVMMLCHDYYTTRCLIEHYNSDYLGVNFDPSHDVLYGNLDIGWIIRQWDKRIKHCHLKDAVGIPEEGKFIFPLLGEGNVNWQEFFKALDEIGYQDYMSVEFESFTYYKQVLDSDPEAAAKISIEQVIEIRNKSAERSSKNIDIKKLDIQVDAQ